MFKASSNSIIWAIVCIIVVMASVMFGLAVTHNIDSNSTPFITTILGGGATTIAALVALLKADVASQKVDVTQGKVDDLHSKVEDGMIQVAMMAADSATDPLDKPEHVERLRQIIRQELEAHDKVDQGDGK